MKTVIVNDIEFTDSIPTEPGAYWWTTGYVNDYAMTLFHVKLIKCKLYAFSSEPGERGTTNLNGGYWSEQLIPKSMVKFESLDVTFA